MHAMLAQVSGVDSPIIPLINNAPGLLPTPMSHFPYPSKSSLWIYEISNLSFGTCTLFNSL